MLLVLYTLRNKVDMKAMMQRYITAIFRITTFIRLHMPIPYTQIHIQV